MLRWFNILLISFIVLNLKTSQSTKLTSKDGTSEHELKHVAEIAKRYAKLSSIRDIIDTLDFLEKEEEKRGGTPVEEENAWLQICEDEVDVLSDLNDFSEAVKDDLKMWNKCLGKWTSRVSYANWDYVTNLSEENKNKLSKVSVEFAKWHRNLARNAQRYLNDKRYNSSLTSDAQRQVRLMAFHTSPTDEREIETLETVSSELESIYSTATVGDKKLKLEPDITEIMSTSRDYDELLSVWKGWRDATGLRMKQKYAQMVTLLNKGARDNGFDDFADAWMVDQFDGTDPDTMEDKSEKLWQELKPLYEQLHAYIRDTLKAQYHDHADSFKSGAIPAHLAGNMWAQNWENIADIVQPYPDVTEPDYDAEMRRQNYDVDKMFSMAEEFYTSIGLFPMTESFNKYSMKVRPDDGREVVCHASAEDFKARDDFRIKMCTNITMGYFETIHHEMGHIEYFMAYRNQPTIYRDGANSAFHEAIGDTISLSVMSRKHLKTIGLDKTSGPVDGDSDVITVDGVGYSKSDINYLMKRALFKIAFLPFGYMIDKWRWDVFRNVTSVEKYNKHWWELRLKYQGIVAPIERSEADFDPGAKFHIPSNSPYICYFISFITQFQFYEAMCNKTGHQGKLFDCDFYKSKEAGNQMKAMLELGKSKPWPEALETLTGSQEISTSSILKYFKPLEEWLKMKNSGSTIGWEGANINWAGEDELEKEKRLIEKYIDLLTDYIKREF